MSPTSDETPLDRLAPLLRELDSIAWGEAFDPLYAVAAHGAKHAKTALSAEDIEEVASEAVAETARQIAALETWRQITAFTFVAARRGAIDRLRKLRALKRHVPGSTEISAPGYSDDPAVILSPNTAAKWAEVSAITERLVGELGEPAASLVRGYTLEGLSYAELAHRSKMPLGTVAAIIYRSMRRLERGLGRSSKLAQELSLYLRLIL